MRWRKKRRGAVDANAERPVRERKKLWDTHLQKRAEASMFEPVPTTPPAAAGGVISILAALRQLKKITDEHASCENEVLIPAPYIFLSRVSAALPRSLLQSLPVRWDARGSYAHAKFPR